MKNVVLCPIYLYLWTVHCSIKDAYTFEITFLALNPCFATNKYPLRLMRAVITDWREIKFICAQGYYFAIACK